MENQKRMWYRYIAGSLLVLSLVSPSRSIFADTSFVWNVLAIAATALMAAAMFTEKYFFVAVGAALRLPNLLIEMFRMGKYLFKHMFSYRTPFRFYNAQLFFMLSSLLTTVSVIFLILAVYNRSKAKKFCFLSVGIHVAGFVMWTTARIVVGSNFGSALVVNLLTELLACVPIALIGFVLQSGERKTVPQKVEPVIQTDTSERIEKLLKLKSLLDDGMLSQEEFDAKKKQLLDL